MPSVGATDEAGFLELAFPADWRTIALTVGAVNGPPEAIAAAVITVVVVATWWQAELRPGGASV